jgi:hypothetical protein
MSEKGRAVEKREKMTGPIGVVVTGKPWGDSPTAAAIWERKGDLFVRRGYWDVTVGREESIERLPFRLV